jgi:hypothetical protein
MSDFELAFGVQFIQAIRNLIELSMLINSRAKKRMKEKETFCSKFALTNTFSDNAISLL